MAEAAAGLTESSNTSRPSEVSISSSDGCFAVIHAAREEIRKGIDQAYGEDELRTTTFEMTVMRPLRDAILGLKAPSLFYALLINRVQFQTESGQDIAMTALCSTRSAVCELLCIDLSSNYSKPEQAFQLVRLLTISYHPFMGASVDMFEDQPTSEEMGELLRLGDDNPANALEMAILSESKNFLATPLLQNILSAIYDGDITYLPLAHGNAIIADEYKSQGAEIYDPCTRPILDHYALRIPKVRAVLETANFLIMLLLFVAFHATQDQLGISPQELVFNIWTLGFALDEFAQHRNGNYFADVWNALDFAYLLVWVAYLGLRGHGLITGTTSSSWLALDTLSVGSIVLLPRLVGSVLKRNIVVLGVQSMFMAYLRFLILAFLAASGFLFTFWILSNREKSIIHILWIMLRVWLGGYFITESEASSYHPIYGPILMVVFALFSNSLLVTVLISILSDTFAKVQKNATREFLFEKAVKTLERLKGDMLLEYVPPMNLLQVFWVIALEFYVVEKDFRALLIIGPAQLVLKPRALHKLHVFLVRLTSFPILLTLAVINRVKHHGGIILSNSAGSLFGGLTQGMMVPLDGSARTQLLASRVFEKNVNIDIVPSATSSKLQQSQPPSGQPARPRASGAWTSVFSRYMNPVDVPDSMETRLQNVENSVNHIESMLSELLNQLQAREVI